MTQGMYIATHCRHLVQMPLKRGFAYMLILLAKGNSTDKQQDYLDILHYENDVSKSMIIRT